MIKFISSIGLVGGVPKAPRLSVSGTGKTVKFHSEHEKTAVVYSLRYRRERENDDDEKENEWKEQAVQANTDECTLSEVIPGANYELVGRYKVLTNMLWSEPSNSKIVTFEMPDFDLFRDSVIIKGNEMQVLKQWLIVNVRKQQPSAQLKANLLYRMSRDGQAMKIGKEKYFNKGATVTIIKPKGFDHVCGGYTSKPWKEGGGWTYESDDNAFVFLLRSQFGHEPKIWKPKDPSKSVTYGYGPSFGTSCTLRIVPDESSRTVYSGYDSVYEIQGNTLLGGEKYDETNRGQRNYFLEDYEVYQIELVAAV